MDRQLQKYPFLRLLFPLITGILLADHLFFSGIKVAEELLLWATAISTISLFIVYPLSKYPTRWLFGLFLTLCMFLSGATLATYSLSDVRHIESNTNTAYRVIVTATPEKKANSILCQSEILHRFDSVTSDVSGKILLYLFPDSAAQQIERGDELLFYGRLSMPRNNGNPDEFDYPRYLTRKGISGTAYADAGKWEEIPRSADIDIKEIALDCREHILDIYRKLGFAGDELAVLSALTVGYKEELSEDISESFSVSGASHVLALSGLHIGILYALIFFVLKKCFGNGKTASILRAVIIILALWCFAFITGLSPSVLRSVCMVSLISLSQINSGKMLTIHSLTVSAFFMLLFNPMWLFDVGFQLSYIAVLGIVLIQPRMYRLLEIRNIILRYFWGVITVSAAAQIATAPLVLFYFSRFSTHFLLTNLLVILLVSAIVYGAVLMLLLTPLLPLQQLVADILNLIIKGLNHSVRWIEQLPYSSIDHVWLHPLHVIIFYLLVLILIRYTLKFKRKYVFAVAGCLFFLISHNMWIKADQSTNSNIIFYNVRNCPVVHCIGSNGKSWMIYADTVADTKRLERSLSGYWNRRKLHNYQPVVSDLEEDYLVRKDNMVLFNNKRICIVNDNRWNNKFSTTAFDVDYIYICKGFTGNLNTLTALFPAKCIVLDASLPSYRRNLFVADCKQLGLNYVLVNEKALIVDC